MKHAERRPGTFYFRSMAFLHFHEDPEGLFADAKLNLLEFERTPVDTEEEQAALLGAVACDVASSAVSSRKQKT